MSFKIPLLTRALLALLAGPTWQALIRSSAPTDDDIDAVWQIVKRESPRLLMARR
jgi:hypothetical protein